MQNKGIGEPSVTEKTEKYDKYYPEQTKTQGQIRETGRLCEYTILNIIQSALSIQLFIYKKKKTLSQQQISSFIAACVEIGLRHIGLTTPHSTLT